MCVVQRIRTEEYSLYSRTYCMFGRMSKACSAENQRESQTSAAAVTPGDSPRFLQGDFRKKVVARGWRVRRQTAPRTDLERRFSRRDVRLWRNKPGTSGGDSDYTRCSQGACRSRGAVVDDATVPPPAELHCADRWHKTDLSARPRHRGPPRKRYCSVEWTA